MILRILLTVVVCTGTGLMAACGGESSPPEPPLETKAPEEPTEPFEPGAQAEAPGEEPRPDAEPEMAAPAEDGAESVQDASGEVVTVYRDEWGVPHVFADSEVGAAFATGYCMAEDRLEDVLKNILIATGYAAKQFGSDYIPTDAGMRLVQNDQIVREYYDSTTHVVARMSKATADGIRTYMQEHPDKVPEWAPDVEDHHPLAIGRLLILQWPLGAIMNDYFSRDGGEEMNPVRGSNGWAVSPDRTEMGAAILLADPHLDWGSLQYFYEARVHGGSLAMAGFFIPGAPLLAIGHTGNVGFACTTGGPDTSDVFYVEANPQMQYKIDGEWKTPEIEMSMIEVKDGMNIPLPIVRTELGILVPDPDMKNPDTEKGLAYIGKSPYFSDTGLVEQMYRMCLAKDAHEFYDALGMNHFMEQNVLFADRKGNIGYVRTGRTPIRPEGYDWSKPVPAGPDTEWQGIHPIEDLVQVMNPAIGYMQNCNISPANMMVDSPMTPDKYREYIYNVSWDRNNPRGKRATRVLHETGRMTAEDAIALAMDVTDIYAESWTSAIQAAVEGHAGARMDDPDYNYAANTLMNWDGQFRADSSGALLMYVLRSKVTEVYDPEPLYEGEAPSDENLAKLADAVEAVAAYMNETYKTVELPYGGAFRAGRGTRSFPSSGADFGRTETLYDIEYEAVEEEPGIYMAKGGSMATTLMIMREEGIESYTISPIGQSKDPESPHYVDQAERLLGPLKMKPVHFTRAEVEQQDMTVMELTVP